MGSLKTKKKFYRNHLTKKNQKSKFIQSGGSATPEMISGVQISITGLLSSSIQKINFNSIKIQFNSRNNYFKEENPPIDFNKTYQTYQTYQTDQTDQTDYEQKTKTHLALVKGELENFDDLVEKEIICSGLHGKIITNIPLKPYINTVPSNCIICYLSSPDNLFESFKSQRYGSELFDFLSKQDYNTLDSFFKYRSLYSLPDDFQARVKSVGNESFIMLDCLKNSTWFYPHQNYFDLNLTSDSKQKYVYHNILLPDKTIHRTTERKVKAKLDHYYLSNLIEECNIQNPTSLKIFFISSCMGIYPSKKIYKQIDPIFKYFSCIYDVNTNLEDKKQPPKLTDNYPLCMRDSLYTARLKKNIDTNFVDRIKSDNFTRAVPFFKHIIEKLNSGEYSEEFLLYFLKLSFNKKLKFLQKLNTQQLNFFLDRIKLQKMFKYEITQYVSLYQKKFIKYIGNIYTMDNTKMIYSKVYSFFQYLLTMYKHHLLNDSKSLELLTKLVGFETTNYTTIAEFLTDYDITKDTRPDASIQKIILKKVNVTGDIQDLLDKYHNCTHLDLLNNKYINIPKVVTIKNKFYKHISINASFNLDLTGIQFLNITYLHLEFVTIKVHLIDFPTLKYLELVNVTLENSIRIQNMRHLTRLELTELQTENEEHTINLHNINSDILVFNDIDNLDKILLNNINCKTLHLITQYELNKLNVIIIKNITTSHNLILEEVSGVYTNLNINIETLEINSCNITLNFDTLTNLPNINFLYLKECYIIGLPSPEIKKKIESNNYDIIEMLDLDEVSI